MMQVRSGIIWATGYTSCRGVRHKWSLGATTQMARCKPQQYPGAHHRTSTTAKLRERATMDVTYTRWVNAAPFLGALALALF